MEVKKQKTAADLRGILAAENSSAREKITALFDTGTFVELGAYVRRAVTEYDSAAECEFEGVITGYGAIDGRLIFAFVQDYSRVKGALSEAHAKKICNLYDAAMKNKAPIVGIMDSAGAFIMEGVGALSGYGSIMRQSASASGIIPQIAVITGLCAGSMAAIAGLFDFVIGAADKGEFYVNPPFLMREKTKDKTEGTIKKAASSGAIDMTATDTNDAFVKLKELLKHLPSCYESGTVYEVTSDEANRLTPEIEGITASGIYDMKQVIKAISDEGIFIETGSEYASEMITGFIQLRGATIALAANQPSVNGGVLSASAAVKAAKIADFSSAFNIPLLTLVDTTGFDLSAESENAPYMQAIAKLSKAYAISDNGKVTVVIGNAYGSAFTIMGSKALGADIVFAVDKAKISAMAPEAAVKFAWDSKIKASKDPVKSKEELLEEWKNIMASPVSAAKNGDIDDIITYEELRQRTAAAFEMLSYASEV